MITRTVQPLVTELGCNIALYETPDYLPDLPKYSMRLWLPSPDGRETEVMLSKDNLKKLASMCNIAADLDSAYDILMKHAIGDIQHDNLGLCPYYEEPDSRDDRCRVCRALDTIEKAQ